MLIVWFGIWVIKLIFSRMDLIGACMSYYWEVEPNMEWYFSLNTENRLKNVSKTCYHQLIIILHMGAKP